MNTDLIWAMDDLTDRDLRNLIYWLWVKDLRPSIKTIRNFVQAGKPDPSGNLADSGDVTDNSKMSLDDFFLMSCMSNLMLN